MKITNQPQSFFIKIINLFDTSLWSLLISNLVTIIMFNYGLIQFTDIFWVYWAQSIIIGIFNFFKILNQEAIDTTGLQYNGSYVAPTKATTKSIAIFFAFHYGIFHFVYFVFIFSFTGKLFFTLEILLTILIFFFNHLYSFLINNKREKYIKKM